MDDIELSIGYCQDVIPSPSPTPPTEEKPLTCNFEKNSLCGWSQSQIDQADWILTSGMMMNETLGPLVDHTTTLANGKFLV